MRILGNVAVAIVLVLAAACQSPSDYKKMVGTFAAAATQTAEVSTAYLDNLNRIERDAYLSERRWDRTKPLEAGRLGARLFTDEELAVRHEAIAAVAAYAKVLNALTSTDSAQAVATNAKEVGAQAKSVSDRIRALAGAGVSGGPPIGILAQAFGELARILIEERQLTTLRDLVKVADGPLKRIAAGLKADIEGAADRELIAHNRNRREALIFYNDRRLVLTDDQRRKMLDDVKALEDTRLALIERRRSVGGLFDEFAEAHAALVKAAVAGGRGADTATALARIERFLRRADALAKPLTGLAGS